MKAWLRWLADWLYAFLIGFARDEDSESDAVD